MIARLMLRRFLLIFDLSGNLNSSINTKQNIITVSTPLIKNDISNNIRIDLSAYV